MDNQYQTAFPVELPGWGGDNDKNDVFRAVLRRPSLLAMAAAGNIPNELMTAAQQLFCEGYGENLPLDQLGRLLLAVAKEALVKPTFEELDRDGCRLTDVQLAAIYSFAQAGVRALLPFRHGGDSAFASGNGEAV